MQWECRGRGSLPERGTRYKGGDDGPWDPLTHSPALSPHPGASSCLSNRANSDCLDFLVLQQGGQGGKVVKAGFVVPPVATVTQLCGSQVGQRVEFGSTPLNLGSWTTLSDPL